MLAPHLALVLDIMIVIALVADTILVVIMIIADIAVVPLLTDDLLLYSQPQPQQWQR